MGSRIMHCCIAALFSRKLDFEDWPFLLGNLAPDVSDYGKQSKSRSHFIRLDAAGEGFFDFERYAVKYLREQRTSFHIGYYFHLMADDIWNKRIYRCVIKEQLPAEEKEQAKQQYYRDLYRLNGKLIRYYRLEQLDPSVGAAYMDNLIPMTEAEIHLLPLLLADLKHDLDPSDPGYNEPLEILKWEQVTDTLEFIAAACLKQWQMWEEADLLFAEHGYQNTLKNRLSID